MVVWKVQTSVDRVRERLHCKSFAQKKNENFVQGIFADAEYTYDFFLCFGAFTRELTLLTFSSYFPVHSLRSLPLSPPPPIFLLLSSYFLFFFMLSPTLLFHFTFPSPSNATHLKTNIVYISSREQEVFHLL